MCVACWNMLQTSWWTRQRIWLIWEIFHALLNAVTSVMISHVEEDEVKQSNPEHALVQGLPVVPTDHCLTWATTLQWCKLPLLVRDCQCQSLLTITNEKPNQLGMWRHYWCVLNHDDDHLRSEWEPSKSVHKVGRSWFFWPFKHDILKYILDGFLLHPKFLDGMLK